ncbi:hypothetical protein O3P69_009111, partial [Scylla paramamosain]
MMEDCGRVTSDLPPAFHQGVPTPVPRSHNPEGGGDWYRIRTVYPIIKAMNPLVFRQDKNYLPTTGPSSRKRQSDYRCRGVLVRLRRRSTTHVHRGKEAITMSAKRKHDSIASATQPVFGEDEPKTNFLEMNGEGDGDSSDPEASDIEDDSGSEEEDEGNDSGEEDSLDEDEVEASEDDDDEEEEGSDAEDESDDDEEEEETNDKKEKGSKRTVSEVKVDRDSGIDDPPQAKVRLKKVKSKVNEKRKQVGVNGGKSDAPTSLSSSSTAHSSTATPSGITPAPATSVRDEYEEDSSDEEDLRNTMGNVPIRWYDEYPHLGYDLDGKQILKPKRGDTLDNFLNRMENPDF